MPYIDKADRPQYDPLVTLAHLVLGGKPIGHVVYVLYRVILRWAICRGKISFESMCLVFGAWLLLGADLLRRVATPYECRKECKNGDVPEVNEWLNGGKE